MRRVPGAGGDEVGQGLTIAVLAEPGGHRLDRLTLPVGQQPPQIDLPPPALILARERLEHLRRERLQLDTHRSNLVRSHTPSTPHRARRTRITTTDLTKHY
jgi:hypothetical protein